MTVSQQGAGTQHDLIAIGETMAAFVSRDEQSHYVTTPAGAESNVAIGMARLGCRTRWVSRLGDDPLGRFVAETIRAAGVEVAIEFDPQRPTGVLVKHVMATAARVDYYRSESAARALHSGDLERAGSGRIWHVTGITPALSESALHLVERVLARRSPVHGRTSFDINLRHQLWPDTKTAAGALLPLARQADVVFIGNDEAEALLSTSDPQQVATRILRRDDQELILKRGPEGASVITRNGLVFEPAVPVVPVDVTGAGDAFAAGYLAGLCWDLPLRARLRLGNRMASRVIGSIEDISPPFAPGELDSFLRG